MIVLRFAIGSVFLWFGVDKWIHPDAWFGWIPSWLWSNLPVAPTTFLFANGAFEFVIGVLFLSGRYLRTTAAVAGAFLLAIGLSVGVSEVTIRDSALIGICLALAMDANARAKRPIQNRIFSTAAALYVIYLFVYGMIYLRGGA